MGRTEQERARSNIRIPLRQPTPRADPAAPGPRRGPVCCMKLHRGCFGWPSPVTRCLERLHGDQGTAFQLGFETGQDLSNHCNDLRGHPTLHPHTNYGWSSYPETARIAWKSASSVTTIVGLAHPDLTHVHTVMSKTAQNGGRVPSELLDPKPSAWRPVRPRCFPSRCPLGSQRQMPAPA